eukprot:515551-Prymnesium_polylepis.1
MASLTSASLSTLLAAFGWRTCCKCVKSTPMALHVSPSSRSWRNSFAVALLSFEQPLLVQKTAFDDSNSRYENPMDAGSARVGRSRLQFQGCGISELLHTCPSTGLQTIVAVVRFSGRSVWWSRAVRGADTRSPRARAPGARLAW